MTSQTFCDRMQPQQQKFIEFCSSTLHKRKWHNQCGKGRRNGGALRGHRPPVLWKEGNGGTGAVIMTYFISNYMICQDRLETIFLQLFAHT